MYCTVIIEIQSSATMKTNNPISFHFQSFTSNPPRRDRGRTSPTRRFPRRPNRAPKVHAPLGAHDSPYPGIFPFPRSIKFEMSSLVATPLRSRSRAKSVAEAATTLPPAAWHPTQPLEENAPAASPSKAHDGAEAVSAIAMSVAHAVDAREVCGWSSRADAARATRRTTSPSPTPRGDASRSASGARDAVCTMRARVL